MKLFDAYKAVWALLPELSQDEIKTAVDAAGPRVTLETPEKLQRLCININASFQSYMREQLWHAVGAPPSAVAERLERVAERTVQLIEALGACDDYSPVEAAAVGCLAFQAARYGEGIGGYPGLPPREFVVPDTDPIVHRVDYRGEEKVEEIIRGLSLLRVIAEDARRYERAKVEEKYRQWEDPRLPPAIPAMRTLFCELDRAWLDTFGVVPKTNVSSGGGKAGGPYVRFVSTVLATYREKIPAEIDTYAPGLRDSLELTSDAIRAHARRARDHIERQKRA